MPKSKFFQLLAKFAADQETLALPEGDDPISFGKRQEDLGYDLQMKTRLVISEMEHELGLLQQRGFDPEMLKLFSGVRHKLETIYKQSRPQDPVKTARDLIFYLDDRHTKAILSNLEFLAKHHLEKTNVSFKPNPLMVQPKIRGFSLIPKLEELAREVLSVTVKPSELQPTFRPPSRQNTPAVVIPGPAKLPTTPLPPTKPESPEAKRLKEEEVG